MLDPDEPPSLGSRSSSQVRAGDPGPGDLLAPAGGRDPGGPLEPDPIVRAGDPGPVDLLAPADEPGSGSGDMDRGSGELGPEAGPYQSLYRRFRPQRFSEVLGQDHVVVPLRRAVHHATVSHAYLFSGPRGTGKTSTARILAKALNCTDLVDGEPCGRCTSCTEIARGTSLDVHELDAASNNGVDAMRELVSRAALGTPGRTKVYIVDEVHMLSTAASNALLKTLEEPPGHVVFVLATTDPQKVLPTIRSRAQHFEFRLLGPDVLVDLLRQVRDRARLGLDDEAVDVAVRRGRGSARDALSVLDQVAAGGMVDDDSSVVGDLAESLPGGDPARVLAAVSRAIGAGYDPQRLATELADHLRQAFLMAMAPDLVTVPDAERQRAGALVQSMGLAAVVRGMERLGVAQVAMRDAPDPRAHLEVALVRLAVPELDDTVAALVERVDRLERRLAALDATPSSTPTASSSSSPPSSGSSPARTPQRAPTGVSSTPIAPSSPLPSSGPGATEAPAADVGPAPAPPGPVPPTASPRPSSSAPLPAGSSSGPPEPATSGPELARRTLGAVRRQQVAKSPQAPPSSPAVPMSDSAPASAHGAPVAAPAAAHGAPSAPAAAHGAPSAPAAAAGSAAASGSAAADLLPSREELVQAWGDQVLAALPSRARARFRVGRFLAVEAGTAVFALPNDTHRSYCEEVRGDVEAALGARFGRRVPLRLVVDTDADPLRRPPPAGAGAQPPSGAGASPQPSGAGARPPLSSPPDVERFAPTAPIGPGDQAEGRSWPEPTDYHELLDTDALEAETQPAGAGLTPEQRLRQAFPGAEEV